MERIELSDGIVEVTHVKVSETTDGLIDEEIKAGCKMLKFTCPKCGGWIGNAVGEKCRRQLSDNPLWVFEQLRRCRPTLQNMPRREVIECRIRLTTCGSLNCLRILKYTV